MSLKKFIKEEAKITNTNTNEETNLEIDDNLQKQFKAKELII